jgi:hypothetical protein
MTLTNEKHQEAWSKWFSGMHGFSTIAFVSPLWLWVGLPAQSTMEHWVENAPQELKRVEVWSHCVRAQLAKDFGINRVWSDPLCGDQIVKYAFVRCDEGWSLDANDEMQMTSGANAEVTVSTYT